ncbi:MAG: phage tail sheath subtilisin-like domain-containing protein [Gaiellaceae bacterium]
MPSTLTYPGVYVEELPSGVRTITGVATSITAFVGSALRGRIDEPVTITSYADFERIFGGLWVESTLGYAVRDFYRHGGSMAIVVRVHKPKANDTASISLGAGTRQVALEAASPGAWGLKLDATIDDQVKDTSDATLFNLTVTDSDPVMGKTEVFRNVSFAVGSPRRVDLVLAAESTLVRMTGALPTQPQSSFPVTQAAANGNDGNPLDKLLYTTGANLRANKKGLYALEKVDLVNLVVVPPYTAGNDVDSDVLADTISYATERRAVVVMGPPAAWLTIGDAETGATAASFTSSKNAAVYFPRIRQLDPLRDDQLGTFSPAGAIAGVIARTDATRGVWKAPAGLEATLSGVAELAVPLTDLEIGRLNPLGVNCLRAAPAAGHVVWGARTREGSDRLTSEWKYLPVRRTALFLEESLYRGTQWVVFEPNDAPLWAQIRLNVGAFMNNLFRQGAFAGTTPREAYFVKCDAESTTQDDVNLGIVNIIVGFAPLKPAEFVVLKLQQMAGQTGSA